MSEKDIRDTLKVLTEDFMKDNYNDMILSAVYGVLDGDPDVVLLLRWANERRVYYLDQVSLTHDCQRDKNFYKGKAGMAAEIQGYCQQFVRLTDEEPGWEWKENNGTD